MDLSRSVVYGGCAAISFAMLLLAVAELLRGGAPETLSLPLGLPWLRMHLRLDALSAYFMTVVNLGGVAASVYGLGYGRHEGDPVRVLPFYPVFLAGMNLVLLADDAFTFVFAWELMSLFSWLLVLASHREADTPRAAQVYLLMASLGTGLLLLAFGILSLGVGAYDFEHIRATELASLTAIAAITLAFAGTASKAGIVPLHVWLPLAHPAAPSHVSALMSGVMTKVALYGTIRILFDLVGGAPWWWGGLMLAFGGLTAVLGVLFAIVQDDLKKLLAYSTVENVGLIVVGLGLALVFQGAGMAEVSALALAAALLHALNHTAFKSLLFLGAGAVVTATGERDLERLGGLIHRLPTTAFVFLVGAAAISALPPLNGFVSEWLTFQAILRGPDLPQWELKIGTAVIAALLALAAALAAACYVRAFGIAFLGRPRSPGAADAREVEPTMLAAMIGLAGVCLVLGVVPVAAFALIQPVVDLVLGVQSAPTAGSGAWLWLTPPAAGGNSYSGLTVLVVVAFFASLTVLGIHHLASRRVRRSIPWACGYGERVPAAQYSASSFAQPLRRVFASALRAEETVDMPDPGDPAPARFAVTMRDLVWDTIYAPIVAAVAWLSLRLNDLQFLTIRRYLSLMFAALVTLLFLVAVTQ
jgi:formate hydrogenlyase subunit 3/multisubunit Na+/H+ antiporter MnhD subunit